MAEVIECQENILCHFGILSSSLKFKKGESLSFCDRAGIRLPRSESRKSPSAFPSFPW